MHKSYGTGRRKTSSARVYLHEGTGVIKINSREIDDFITSKTLKSYLISNGFIYILHHFRYLILRNL